MNDYIVRATAADGQVRAFAATTKELVEAAREHHNTSPVATWHWEDFLLQGYDGKYDEE